MAASGSFGRPELERQRLSIIRRVLALAQLLLESVDLSDVDVAILLLDVRPEHDPQLYHRNLRLHLLREDLGLPLRAQRLREGDHINTVRSSVPLVDAQFDVIVVVELRLRGDVRVVSLLALVFVDLLQHVVARDAVVLKLLLLGSFQVLRSGRVSRLRLASLLLPPHSLVAEPLLRDFSLHARLEVLHDFAMTSMVVMGRSPRHRFGRSPGPLLLQRSLPPSHPFDAPLVAGLDAPVQPITQRRLPLSLRLHGLRGVVDNPIVKPVHCSNLSTSFHLNYLYYNQLKT